MIKSFKEYNSFEGCVDSVIDFMKSNNINTWDELINASPFQRSVIDTLIDSDCKNMEDVKTVKFLIKVKISDVNTLKRMLKKYEDEQDFEKCQIINNKINSK